MKETCFWSVGDGEHAYMLETFAQSYHSVGMTDDLYMISDREITGAKTILVKEFDKSFFFFKFFFLRNIMKNYAYKYFIFLDADTFFVRKPPPLLALVHDSPIHSFFEADCTRPLPEQTWHRCPLQTYVRLMHESGVASKKIYASNGGFFIVQREFIDTVCDLAADFWKHAFLSGYAFTEEPSLTYATHMLCKNPDAHLLQNYPEVWSNDWEGHFANNFPDGRPWTFTDYLSKKQYPVNPAIVHMMKGKKLLIDAGKKLALQKS